MDGNGRWAAKRHLPRLEGHKRGADRARDVVQWAMDAGVRQLSLYAFSTENWERPKSEVRGLMSLLATLLPQQLPLMQQKGIRMRVLGDVAALPPRARKAVEHACEQTRKNDQMDLALCLNYGGQQEILAGVRRALKWLLAQENPEASVALMDADRFRSMLWCGDLLPVDLIIRTGGEQRISNFHLWDAAYAELYFTDIYWPDFSERDFQDALVAFAERERRFGRISGQLIHG